MKVAKTLSHKIMNHTGIFDETLNVYNQAMTYIIEVIDKEIGDLEKFSSCSIVAPVEKLLHSTKSNPSPKYKEFNRDFYKFPSYFRRNAIAAAFGKVKSYRSNYQNWEKERIIAVSEGKKFRKNPPKLQHEHKEFPVFYKGNMFIRTSETTAQIKVFHNNDWVWVDIEFKGQDLYKRDVWDWKEHNPKLVKVGKKYFLNISYSNKVRLSNTDMTRKYVQ
nr:hypothetical protein [Fredinandcohnia onubensis]